MEQSRHAVDKFSLGANEALWLCMRRRLFMSPALGAREFPASPSPHDAKNGARLGRYLYGPQSRRRSPQGGQPRSLTPARCAHVSIGGIAPSSSACLATQGSGMKGSGAMKPSSSMFYVHEADVVQIHHFLEECSLCAKPLSGDIFMYRGDTPFCSEECRQQQIEVDRAKHRRKKRAAAHALAARKEHRHQQPQTRPPGMDHNNPWVDAPFARAPALRV